MNRESMQEEFMHDQKEKRLKAMKKPSFFIVLSCFIRLAYSLAFFNLTGFILSLLLIVLGFFAACKKSKCSLLGYGIGSLIQATVMYGLFIYIGIKFPQQPLAFYLINSLYMVFITLGGFFALKLRRQILEYETLYGPVPRCCRRGNNAQQVESINDDERNMTFISIPSETTQPTIPEPQYHQPTNAISSPIICIPQNMIPNVYEQINQPQPLQMPQFQMMQMAPQQQFEAQQQQFPPQQPQYVPHQYFPRMVPQVIPQQVFVPQNNVFYRI